MPSYNGSYTEYKRCTNKFLDWVRKTGACCNETLKNLITKNCPLRNIEIVVNAIRLKVSEAGKDAIGEDNWKGLPVVLGYCNNALRLRAKATSFYESLEKSDETHKYFYESLQKWYSHLSVMFSMHSNTAEEKDLSDIQEYILESKFSSLYLEEEEEEEKEDSVSENDTTAENRKQSSGDEFDDNSFEEDLDFEMTCLLIDLDQLMTEVCKVWLALKKEETTLYTATIVTNAAIKCVERMDALIQLRYPSFDSMFNLYENGIMRILSESFLMKILSSQNKLNSDTEAGRTPYKRATGFIATDIFSVMNGLQKLTSAIPANRRSRLILREGFFGPDYNEYTHPIADTYDASNRFLLQELPIMYNQLLSSGDKPFDLVSEGTSNCQPSLDAFMNQVKQFFVTKKVTLPFTFSCICWIYSTIFLQGGGYLGRVIYSAKQSMKELYERLNAALKKGNLREASNDLDKMVRVLSVETKFYAENMCGLVRMNAFLAGVYLVSYSWKCIIVGTNAIYATSRFRAFGHLYSALLHRGFIQSIPLWDNILTTYDRVIFYPSRPTYGSFHDYYMLSSHLTVDSLNKLKNNQEPSKGASTHARLERMIMPEDFIFSYKVSRWSNGHKDPELAKARDAAELLQEIRKGCEKDQFEGMRGAALDLVTLNDYLKACYEAAVRILKLTDSMNRFLTGSRHGHSAEWMQNYALEVTIAYRYIFFLDRLAVDSNGNYSADINRWNAPSVAGARSNIFDSSVALIADSQVDRIVHDLKNLAGGITAFFQKHIVDSKCYHFPSQKDVVTNLFGSPTIFTAPELDLSITSDLFRMMMSKFENQNEVIPFSEYKEMRLVILECPGILGQTFVDNEVLPNLLFQASAGVHANAHFLEWILHFDCIAHHNNSKGYNAFHCAIEAGKLQSVKILLESTNWYNTNMPTAIDCDYPLHIALKHNHGDIAEYLTFSGAEAHRRNRAGKYPYQLTTDSALKAKYLKDQKLLAKSEVAALNHVSRSEYLSNDLNNQINSSKLRLQAQKQAESMGGIKKGDAMSISYSATEKEREDQITKLVAEFELAEQQQKAMTNGGQSKKKNSNKKKGKK